MQTAEKELDDKPEQDEEYKENKYEFRVYAPQPAWLKVLGQYDRSAWGYVKVGLY